MPDEYVIPLSIDVNAIVQKAQTAKTSLSDIGNEAKKAGADAKAGFDNAARSAKDLSSNLVDNSVKYGQLTKSIEQLEIKLQSYQRVAKTSLDPKVIADYNSKVQALQTQIGQLSNVGKKGFDDVGNAIEKTGNPLTKAFSVLRRLAYILPGIGIAGILAFFTGPIIEYVSKLSFASDALKLATSNLKNLNEVSKNASKQYGEQSTNLRILYDATQDVSNSEHDRLLAAQELQKEFPSLFGNIKTETILNGGAADAYRDATTAILENAKAKAAATKISELAAQQLDVDFEKQKITNARFAELARVQQDQQLSRSGNVQGGTGGFLTAEEVQNDIANRKKTINDRADASQKLQDIRKKDLQNQIDFLTKFAGGENKIAQALISKDKLPKQKDTNDAILAQRKALLDELVKLQNDYNSAQIAAIEDGETKEIAQNDVNYQNKVRTLKQQQQDLIAQAKANKFPELAQLIQDNIQQISVLIAKTEEEGQAADVAIIHKYAALKLKAQQDSLRQIGVLLKDETEDRINAVKANYDKVITEARKNGVLTNELERKLTKQQQSDISDIESSAVLKRLKEQKELKDAEIRSQANDTGLTQKGFENKIQRELLDIDIEFAKKRVEVLAATLAINGTLTPDQKKALADAVDQLNKLRGQKAENAEADKGDLLKQLGISDKGIENIQKYAAAVSTAGQVSKDLFDAIASTADARVQAIQKQIDAIDQLVQADQDAVDKQQALFDKGRANSLDAAKKKLEDDKKQKAALQKQEEEAQKKRDALQKASLIADALAQTSNLITASSTIFRVFSSIPIVGVPLAIAAIAAMFAGFAVAKANAISAVGSSDKQSFEEGGVAGGDRHSSGGNKYISMDGKDRNILEIERGERIFSRKNSQKHEKLFEAIQNNDYSKLDINDISIRDLLNGTGVMQQLDVARRTGNNNVTLQERANVVVVNGNSDKYLKSIDGKMDNLNRKDPTIVDMGDYVWIDYGNGHTEKRYK